MSHNTDGILVFGGTFDPPHLAHTTLPTMVASRLGLKRLVYVLAALNPLKQDTPPTASHHRLAMLRLVLRDLPNAEISTIELERGGPSYTVDTLTTFREQFGDDVPIRLLIGADQAIEFHKWKDWQRIIELAEPAVMVRPPWSAKSFGDALRETMAQDEVDAWAQRAVEVPAMDISSTEIRRRLHTGSDVSEMLHPDVIAYIREHNLYQHNGGETAK